MSIQSLNSFCPIACSEESRTKFLPMVQSEPIAEEEKLVRYLRDGVMLVASPGISFDCIAGTESSIGFHHIVTDGQWSWPLSLAFYVEKYHFRLPEAFVKHARSNNWKIPSNINVDSLQL